MEKEDKEIHNSNVKTVKNWKDKERYIKELGFLDF